MTFHGASSCTYALSYMWVMRFFHGLIVAYHRWGFLRGPCSPSPVSSHGPFESAVVTHGVVVDVVFDTTHSLQWFEILDSRYGKPTIISRRVFGHGSAELWGTAAIRPEASEIYVMLSGDLIRCTYIYIHIISMMISYVYIHILSYTVYHSHCSILVGLPGSFGETMWNLSGLSHGKKIASNFRWGSTCTAERCRAITKRARNRWIEVADVKPLKLCGSNETKNRTSALKFGPIFGVWPAICGPKVVSGIPFADWTLATYQFHIQMNKAWLH